MQQLVEKLQQMIQNYYGLTSELELKPCHSYQALQKDIYSSMDKCLNVPLFEPKTKHPIAFFKVHNVHEDDTVLHERVYDLVHLTLQSHINMLDEMDVTESLLQYLQVELNSKKILRFRSPKAEPVTPQSTSFDGPLVNKIDIASHNKDLLLLCKNEKALDQLALEIHHATSNHFFLRADALSEDFLAHSEDLFNLSHTTIYIPNIDTLSTEKQEHLTTYMLSGRSQEDKVLIICGSSKTITQMCIHSSVILDLLKSLNVFNILRDPQLNNDFAELTISSLQHYAEAILGTNEGSAPSIPVQTKSYHLIPSLKNLHPTVH